MKKAVLLAGLLAGACVPVDGEMNEVAAAPSTGSCNADAARSLVGRANAPALIEEAKRLTGAQAVRAYGPNDAVTMDYREDRLNLRLDAEGRVVNVTCG